MEATDQLSERRDDADEGSRPGEEAGEERHSHRRHQQRPHHQRTRNCPFCHTDEIRRSRRKGFTEIFVLPLLLRRPFNCNRCLRRFYGYSLGPRTMRLAFLSVGLLAAAGVLCWLLFRQVMHFLRP